MNKKIYVVPEIYLLNICEDLCREHIIAPLSQYPILSKEQRMDFIVDEDEDDEDTRLKEQ